MIHNQFISQKRTIVLSWDEIIPQSDRRRPLMDVGIDIMGVAGKG